MFEQYFIIHGCGKRYIAYAYPGEKVPAGSVHISRWEAEAFTRRRKLWYAKDLTAGWLAAGWMTV